MPEKTKAYRLVEGAVRMGFGPHLIHKSEGCEVWEIDCSTKYASGTTIEGEDEVEVMLYVGEDTLHADETATGPTSIFFPRVGEHVMFEGGRYSWRLAMFTHEPNAEDKDD